MAYFRGLTCDLFLAFVFCCAVVSPVFSEDDMACLQGVKKAVANQSALNSWSFSNTTAGFICSFVGATCWNDRENRLIGLDLGDMSLGGQVPSALQYCHSLLNLDLSGNNLTGPVPSAICDWCPYLVTLDLSNNHLTGPIPDDLANCTFLNKLVLSDNTLSGGIPKQLASLGRLKTISVANNELNGAIPSGLSSYDSSSFEGNSGLCGAPLGKCGLSKKRLTIIIAAGVCGAAASLLLGVVVCFRFPKTQKIKSKIPEEIANYSNLTSIDLSVNYLSGSIPDSFRELPNLQVLILSSNSLSGGIPQFLSSVHTLWRFAANQNSFSGAIPTGITNFVKNLDLSYNQLNGSIPSDLLSQPNLQTVDLSYNSLGGSIPKSISSSLVTLRLGNNHLNGTIPSLAFGSLQKLIYLELDNNSLGGSIPPELGFCENLALLNLAKNQLTGVLPVELGNLTGLQALKLQANSLVGEIPIEITQFQSLRKLDISWNSLYGSIPSSISGLQNLNNLDLRGNNLGGSIPESIGNLNSLLELQLGSNELGGKIPLMPPSLQIALNLSSNQFEGLSPKTLSVLNGLEVLDLSNNRFNGKIPDSFATMGSLTQLVLSNNLLSGLIPLFPPYVSVEITGNTDLIKPTNPSPTQETKKTLALGLLFAVSPALIVIFTGTIVVQSVSRWIYNNSDEQIQSEEHFSQPQVTMGDVLTPNAVHRSNIDGLPGEFQNSLGKMERLIKLVLSNNLLFGLITEFPEHVSVDTIGNTDLLYPTKPSPTQKMMKTLSVGLLVAVASAVSNFVTFIGPAVFLPLYKKAAQIQSEEHFLSLRSLQETLLPQMVFTDPTSMVSVDCVGLFSYILLSKHC
ncbi:hypothetical protein RHSIM_Rhsim10G0041600 [Rhododendron simsii]|uniref:Leucine-rich repeat-containing N-terminal plant-type domain-containing protein n=1 Tax=Rhododendron simsii TaxID=118357 RepID=A0A834GGR2_RHOSS|nr:hypothetical protein RHSIM_Rhsim10G0041600 [Rhododendron simsii]